MMLRSAKHLTGHSLSARDGVLGKVQDFLFDDALWVVRYLTVDSGTWLPGRLVLIAPSAVKEADWVRGVLPVDLTKEQVQNGPGIQVDQPVSRQLEERLHEHYGWTPYWIGREPMYVPPPKGLAERGSSDEGEPKGDPHLRSAREVMGYSIEATDGEVGHVEDLILEDESWTIRYAVVDTRNWLPGRKVLIAPSWIEWIRWNDRKVGVNLDREQVRNSPEFNPADPVNRRYEERLYDYYGRPAYWG